MKKSKKALKRIERVQQVIDLSFEECDCDTPNVSFSSISFGGGKPYTILTEISDNIAVQAILPEYNEDWSATVAIQYKDNGKKIERRVYLSKLIDEIQTIKDLKNEYL
jgi:hypothetical protein